MPHSGLLAATRLLLYVALTISLMPVQAVALMLRSRLAVRLPRAYHQACRWLFGMQIALSGAPSAVRPTLFVCNHVSYLDIMVLGSLIRASFVAKAEVARWPLFGWLAKLQRTVFVNRRRGSTLDQGTKIRTRLLAGDQLILFPEGTSGDGNRTLQFKTALFNVAELAVDGRPLVVQPVSIAYTRLNGIPIGRAWRPFFAWYGDMDLAPHMWRMAGLGMTRVAVHFHEPLTAAECGSRKALARRAHDAVAGGVADLLSGRNPAVAAPVATPELAAAGSM
jgi:1-acyl-sn-glycerol-3-phosphate acyltransferase